MRAGDAQAAEHLLPVVLHELRALARHYLKGERPDHTLQPTALVNEAYLRLVGDQARDWKNRAHFVGVAASIMRRILIDYARRRQALKYAPKPPNTTECTALRRAQASIATAASGTMGI
jgi:RNA polymerase sigma factor (TIGR02999 family)